MFEQIKRFCYERKDILKEPIIEKEEFWIACMYLHRDKITQQETK